MEVIVRGSTTFAVNSFYENFDVWLRQRAARFTDDSYTNAREGFGFYRKQSNDNNKSGYGV